MMLKRSTESYEQSCKKVHTSSVSNDHIISQQKQQVVELIAPKNLIEAAQNGDYCSVEKFLKIPGIDINVTADPNDFNQVDADAVDDRQGGTPLILAAKQGYSGIVKLLINKGADINMVDTLNNTAWFYAAINGNPESLDYLLQAGVNIDSRDKHGKTALYLACEYSNVLAFGFLKFRCANIKLPDNENVTPESIAQHPLIKQIFVSCRLNILSDLGDAIYNNLDTKLWAQARQPAASLIRNNNVSCQDKKNCTI